MIEWSSLWLSVQLAGITMVLLLLLATPVAWWLATSKARWLPVVEAAIALPLVLPPTVLGFYFLIAMNPNSGFGALWLSVTGQQLTFSFTGLVTASVVYSLPFAVQPLQTSFAQFDKGLLEAAATLGAGPIDRFTKVLMPLCAPGFATAAVLTFAHTLGEFGVVLMIGGNIPGETRVVSIAIFEAVETLNYGQAHALALTLLIFSFLTLVVVNAINRAGGRRR